MRSLIQLHPTKPCPRFPFWLGFFWGSLTFIFAGAFQFDGIPDGYAWNRYALSAWGLEQGEYAVYNPFREPLYFILLAKIGNIIGYINAGILISSLSMMMTLFCAGWVTRSCSNDWSAMICMITLPFGASTLSSTRWINHYPLQTAIFSLTIVMLLQLYQKKSWGSLLWASLFWGIGIAVDIRMLILTPLYLLCVGMYLFQKREALGIIILLSLLCIAPYWITNQWVQIPAAIQVSMKDKQQQQRNVVRRWQRFLHDPHIEKYCLPLDESKLVQFNLLFHPCGRATLWNNIREIYPRHIATSTLSGWALLIFCIPPFRKKNRLALILTLSLGAPIGAWASLTHFPDRYMLIPTAIFHSLVPVGLYHFWRKTYILQKMYPLVCLAFFIYLSPKLEEHRTQQTSLQRNVRMQAAKEFLPHIQNDFAPLLDCTEIKLHVAFLPIHPTTKDCTKWLAPSPKKRWAVVSPKEPLPSGWKKIAAHEKFILAQFD